MTWKQYLASHKDQLLTVLVIFIVSIASFGTFNSTIISSDDWSYFVAKYVFGELHPINLTDRRPFILVLYYVLASVFGLRFEFYYFFNFLILFSSALLVDVIVNRAFPGHRWFASAVALTYLIYPVDYTRTWIIMIYIRFWWLVSLGVIWMLLEFVDTGKRWVYILSMIGIILPLGAYEGQFGILLLSSVLIVFLIHNAPFGRKLILLGSVFGIGFSFFIWRIYVQPGFLGIKDTYVETFQFNPGLILSRYLQGAYIFVKGWLDPIQAQLESAGSNLLPWTILYLIIGGIAYLWSYYRLTPQVKLDFHQKLSMAKTYSFAFLIGGAFWIAGYIPVIGLYSPSLYGHASRVNSFAIAGASLMLVAAVVILATFLAASRPQVRLLTAVMLLPFIIAGVFVQQQVNKEKQIAWETQKAVWNGVFRVIPDIKEENYIVIIIPGYEHMRPFQFLPFLSGWEIEASTQVLYNNPKIGGYYYYAGTQEAELQFTKNGFRPIPTDKIIPYRKLIFLYYDQNTKTVALVNDLERQLSLPFTVSNYNPRENVIAPRPSSTKNRWLVK